MRYHFKLTNYTTGEKNRAQNYLTVSNIKPDDVFTDVFGKAASVITNLESLTLSVAEKYLPQLNLVLIVPGIQSFSSIAIIGEIGVDISVFPTSNQLCSWAGRTLLQR